MKGTKIGAILVIIGVAVVIVASRIVREQEKAVYDKRMEYIEKKWPTYRPPEAADYLFSPIPRQPASDFVDLGKIITGIGILTIFIKLVQKTD